MSHEHRCEICGAPGARCVRITVGEQTKEHWRCPRGEEAACVRRMVQASGVRPQP